MYANIFPVIVLWVIYMNYYEDFKNLQTRLHFQKKKI